ncbi:MAG: YlxR family protein [Propionibacteriaceae bacterium]|jgi:predicted RNA-binding protein YlxR (DUF448 family)|nr:YlxR family protein [Propionibacteriaceae bacterium]
MNEPIRLCVGCRGRASQSQLTRWVWDDELMQVVPGRKRPGRGAWLHPSRSCVEQALRRRSIGRALRRDVGTGLDGLRAWADTLTEPPLRSSEPEPNESARVKDNHFKEA